MKIKEALETLEELSLTITDGADNCLIGTPKYIEGSICDYVLEIIINHHRKEPVYLNRDNLIILRDYLNKLDL